MTAQLHIVSTTLSIFMFKAKQGTVVKIKKPVT